jgi:hypothetical protein
MSGPDTDLAYRARIQSEDSEAREYELLIVAHPAWAAPLYLVNAPEPNWSITSQGRVFLAAGFAAEWPDLDAGTGRADGVGALALAITVPDDPAISTILVQMRAAVAAGLERPRLRLEVVEHLSPDIIRRSTPDLPVSGMDWDADMGQAQLTLAQPEFLMRRVGRRFVPAVFPALRAALA